MEKAWYQVEWRKEAATRGNTLFYSLLPLFCLSDLAAGGFRN